MQVTAPGPIVQSESLVQERSAVAAMDAAVNTLCAAPESAEHEPASPDASLPALEPALPSFESVLPPLEPMLPPSESLLPSAAAALAPSAVDGEPVPDALVVPRQALDTATTTRRGERERVIRPALAPHMPAVFARLCVIARATVCHSAIPLSPRARDPQNRPGRERVAFAMQV